ncbi:MAG: dockerin type I domain-containing protein, partial [Phycisphaerales bacterium]|nr:dockerin type I domain-containing protein [Phycisphaerales bacterium]
WPGLIDPCPADLTGDDVVNIDDLLAVIEAWGASGGAADVNEDGAVNVDDLLIVTGAWGPCD